MAVPQCSFPFPYWGICLSFITAAGSHRLLAAAPRKAGFQPE